MKAIAALFFVLNVAVLVWMQMLPNDSAISRSVLAEDARDNIGALELQVESGRAYQRLFDKHQSATVVTRGMLFANAAVFFLASVLFVLRKKESEVTNPGSATS